MVEVIALYVFASFEELYADLPLKKCGYTINNIKTASAADMNEYYFQEHIPADESENRKVRFCNYITEAIRRQERMSEDKAKTKVEVKKILQNFGV